MPEPVCACGGTTACNCQPVARAEHRDCTPPAPGGGEPLYPCDECGTMRTKAEGGTTFTVCDACWEKHYRRTPARPASREHRNGYWCDDLRCAKCYGADTWLKSEAARLTRELAEARARIRDLEAKHD
jgi:hypothetical protein